MNNLFAIVFLLVLTACHGTKDRDHAEDSSLAQAEENTQYTLFTEEVEFYIEHPPLEAGKEAEFLVHLTDLENYRPCSTGRVGIQMDGVTATSGEPATPGIFRVPLIPERAGEFHAVFTYYQEAEIQETEAHIHVYRDHEAIHSEEEESEGHSHDDTALGEIEFLKEQAWKAQFMVEEIRPGPFRAVIPTSGEILAVPGKKQNITAGSRGIIRFADPMLVQGSRVQEGQVLFIISSETLVEDGVNLRYEEARNRMEMSRSRYSRHKTLYAQEAISEREYQESRAGYVEDSLRFFSLAANITADGIQVRAPVTGTIHELLVSDGDYSDSGNLLATLSSNLNLLLRADLPQQYYKQLKMIQTATFRPAYTDQVFTVEEMRGTLLASGVSVAENDHYLPVIFKLENDGQLLEGAFAEVYLQTEEKSNVLAIPLDALSEEQGKFHVYVQVTGESYAKRRVRTGDTDGLFIEIIEGLNAGERIVTQGPMLVRAASMASGVAAPGHSH